MLFKETFGVDKGGKMYHVKSAKTQARSKALEKKRGLSSAALADIEEDRRTLRRERLHARTAKKGEMIRNKQNTGYIYK